MLLRIIILLLHFIPIFVIIPLLQAIIFGLFCGAIAIFQPYKKIVNSFNVFFIILFLVIFTVLSVVSQVFIYFLTVSCFDAFIFLIWFGYFIYWTVKKIRSCYGYNKDYRAQGLNNATNDTVDDALQNIIDDKDWIADRMINPQDYDEKHSSYELYKTSFNDEANN